MNPFRRRRLVGAFLTAGTFALVAVNLLPIAWMVWCSLKDNSEILSGQVGIGRRRSEVVYLARESDGWLAGSLDGSVARYKPVSGGLEPVSVASFGTFSTSWTFDGKDLWSFSADKGLRRHDASLAVVQEWGIGDLKAAWEKSHPGKTWKTLWVNDVLGTSVVATRTHVLAAFRMENGPGALVLDKVSGTIEFPSILSAMDQVLGSPDRDEAWLIGVKGLLTWKPGTSLSKSVPWGEEGLPWDRMAKPQLLGNGELAWIDGETIRIWSAPAGRVVRGVDSTDGLNLGRIQNLAVEAGSDGRIWAACERGVVGLGRSAGHSIDSLQKRGPAIVVAWARPLPAFEPLVLASAGGDLMAGGDQGKLAAIRHSEAASGAFTSLVPLPRGGFYLHWRNYVDLWRNLPFGTYLMNSLLVCTSVMLISMVLASMAGYALARFEFGGKEIFGYSILATQMIPGILFLIPLYILFTRAGEATGVAIVGTRWGLVLLYSAFYVPFTIWILRGFFAAIPKELEEAALVDGCTPLKAFWSVVLPAALPGIVASGIYVFLTVWDELMFAWILTNAETSTIPVGIRLFAGNYQNRYDLMMAAATVATLPVMLLFFLMQRRIVSGLTAGAVKG